MVGSRGDMRRSPLVCLLLRRCLRRSSQSAVSLLRPTPFNYNCLHGPGPSRSVSVLTTAMGREVASGPPASPAPAQVKSRQRDFLGCLRGSPPCAPAPLSPALAAVALGRGQTAYAGAREADAQVGRTNFSGSRENPRGRYAASALARLA